MSYFTTKKQTSGIRFMDDATLLKVKDLIGQRLTIKDYGFLKTKNGNACAIEFYEYHNSFMFAPTVLFNDIEEAEQDLKTKGSVLDELKKSYIIFSEETGKNGRSYYGVTYEEKTGNKAPENYTLPFN